MNSSLEMEYGYWQMPTRKYFQSQPVGKTWMPFHIVPTIYCAEKTGLIRKIHYYREVGGYLEGKHIGLSGNKYYM